MRSDFHSGKTSAARGKTPVISTSGARCGCNMISAIFPRGTMRFMLVEGNVTVAVLLEFLKRLMHNWTRNILLIVDGHPVHKSAAVSNFGFYRR